MLDLKNNLTFETSTYQNKFFLEKFERIQENSK